MNPRKKIIRKTILETLLSAKPYMLEEMVVFSSVCLAIKPNPPLSEFETAIKAMEKDRVIVRLNNGEEVKCKITDEGEAELLQ